MSKKNNKISYNNIFNYNIIIQNSVVRLRPIEQKDTNHLLWFVLDEETWKYFAHKMNSFQDMETYIKEALIQRNLGIRYTFIIEAINTNKIIGSTAFGNYSEKDQRIEIGWSWIGKEFRGTEANKNTKFLLLTFAFDYLNLKRVEFKTDVLNHRARNALLKIGAVEEGILRSHTLMPDSRRRDTIYYSIIENEWQNLQKNIFFSYSSLDLKVLTD